MRRGKITFAHIELTIDFPTINSLVKYVEDNSDKEIYYLDKNNYPDCCFNRDSHVIEFNQNDNVVYSIRIWKPYKNYNMGK